MVVQGHIAQQRLLQVFAAAEPVSLEDVGNAAVETLDHAVGSRCPGLGQPMLYAQRLAQLIELMVAAGLALAAGKQPVCKFLAVVRQKLIDSDRAGLVQCLEKRARTGGALVGLDSHEHPARGPVDGNEQVAPPGLVLHLRQVLHIHVHKARLVALERLVRLAVRLGFEGIQIPHAMAPQAPIQPRARDIRAEELTRDGQQVIQRQQQGAAQMNDDHLLRGCEHRLQAVRRVRAVAKGRALLPLVHGLLGDAVALGQHTGSLVAGSNLAAHGGCGACVLVQGN